MKLISPLIRIQEQLRIFHWQTESYAQHEAFGEAYEDLGKLIDQFVEVYMGKNGRVRAKLTYNIELDNIGESYVEYINSYIEYLNNFNTELDPEVDSDLLNIRDEMKAVLNKLKYLLTLK